MAWEILPNYTLDGLVDLAQSGWESTLDRYLGPFSWIAAIVTWLVILGLGFILIAKAGKGLGITFILVGWFLAAFSWWQIPYAIIAGLGWIYIVALVVLVVALIQTKSPWASVPVAIAVALFTGYWWLYPGDLSFLLWF